MLPFIFKFCDALWPEFSRQIISTIERHSHAYHHSAKNLCGPDSSHRNANCFLDVDTMNIFATHKHPKFAAREHCYVHIVKMIVEYHQLLSTSHRLIDGNAYADKHKLCKATHANHPSAVWVRQSWKNYRWLLLCAEELHRLYTAHSGKEHAYRGMLDSLRAYPENIPDNVFTLPTPAMPDEYKQHCVCLSYQSYLNAKFREWKARDKPMKVVFPCGEPKWYDG